MGQAEQQEGLNLLEEVEQGWKSRLCHADPDVDELNDVSIWRIRLSKRSQILLRYVTPKMAEALNHVLDAGNASAHRAYFPSREDLLTCIELVKHLIHGIYILRPRVDKVAENTPKRSWGYDVFLSVEVIPQISTFGRDQILESCSGAQSPWCQLLLNISKLP